MAYFPVLNTGKPSGCASGKCSSVSAGNKMINRAKNPVSGMAKPAQVKGLTLGVKPRV